MSKGTAINMPPMNALMIQIPDNIAGSVFGIDEMDKIDEEKKEATLRAINAGA
jgi:hypothetical protein